MTKQIFDFNQVVEERAIEIAKGLTFMTNETKVFHYKEEDFVSDLNKIITEQNLNLTVESLQEEEFIELLRTWKETFANCVAEQMRKKNTDTNTYFITPTPEYFTEFAIASVTLTKTDEDSRKQFGYEDCLVYFNEEDNNELVVELEEINWSIQPKVTNDNYPNLVFYTLQGLVYNTKLNKWVGILKDFNKWEINKYPVVESVFYPNGNIEDQRPITSNFPRLKYLKY